MFFAICYYLIENFYLVQKILWKNIQNSELVADMWRTKYWPDKEKIFSVCIRPILF